MEGIDSKVTIHMVSSLDGFIAKKDGSVSWMHSEDKYEKGKTLTDADIAAYLEGIDCYVMGSRTYEHALKLGWPYGEKPVFVLSSRNLPKEKPAVDFYSGDLIRLVQGQLRPKFKNIWMVGGAMLTREFIRLRLADELIVSVMPILLGEGTRFFDFIGEEQRLYLKGVEAYSDGMVELCYGFFPQKKGDGENFHDE